MGPCMCGDICCPSCGPAQGNSRCPVCHAWASEGCENPEECLKRLPEVLDAENIADKAMADAWALELKWQEEHAAEIEAAIRRTD